MLELARGFQTACETFRTIYLAKKNATFKPSRCPAASLILDVLRQTACLGSPIPRFVLRHIHRHRLALLTWLWPYGLPTFLTPARPAVMSGYFRPCCEHAGLVKISPSLSGSWPLVQMHP